MKINFRKKAVLLSALVIVSTASIGVARAAVSEPGSKLDPVVTLSFVEQRIEQLRYYIEEKTKGTSTEDMVTREEFDKLKDENEELKDEIDKLSEMSISKGPQANIEIVEVKNGQSIICKSGSEIILRGGKAKAIASKQGGLSDVTGATDIPMGGNIPPNHLLIVPRDDGRGVYVEDYAIFMIRGEYSIN